MIARAVGSVIFALMKAVNSATRVGSDDGVGLGFGGKMIANTTSMKIRDARESRWMREHARGG